MDYDRIFRVEKLGQRITAPKYQFLTDQELKEAQHKAEKSAKKLLQMPPVMKERDHAPKVLDEDSAIEGYDSAKVMQNFLKVIEYSKKYAPPIKSIIILI